VAITADMHYLLQDAEFFFSSRRRHTRFSRDWSSDVCSSDLGCVSVGGAGDVALVGGARVAVVAGGIAGELRLEFGGEVEGGADRSEERRVGRECRCRRRA